MVRRTAKGQRKFDRSPPPLSAQEYTALRAVFAGWPCRQTLRKRLFNKQLITSPVFSRAILTALGKKALQGREASSPPQQKPVVEARSKAAPSARDVWLAKYANGGAPRRGIGM